MKLRIHFCSEKAHVPVFDGRACFKRELAGSYQIFVYFCREESRVPVLRDNSYTLRLLLLSLDIIIILTFNIEKFD